MVTPSKRIAGTKLYLRVFPNMQITYDLETFPETFPDDNWRQSTCQDKQPEMP
jgi:hypothetical protein